MSKQFKNQYQEKARELRRLEQVYQNECDHKDGKRNLLHPLNNSDNVISQSTQGWSNSAVRCEECGTIFEIKKYAKVDTAAGIRMFHSMANQFKLMVSLPEGEEDMIMEVQAAINTLSNFQQTYHHTIKKLSKDRDGNGNKQNNRRNNGGFGIGGSQFRQRG